MEKYSVPRMPNFDFENTLVNKKVVPSSSRYNAVLQPRLCIRKAFYSEIILGTKYSVLSVFSDLHTVQGHGLSTKYIICSEKILGTKYSLPGMFSFLREAFDPGLKEKLAKCYSVPRTHSVRLKKKNVVPRTLSERHGNGT